MGMDVGAPATPTRREIQWISALRRGRPTAHDVLRLAVSARWIAVPLGLALGVRLAVFIVASAAHLFHFHGESNADVLGPWQRRDAVWYLAIARYGYNFSPVTASRANFFPLYPLLVRIVQPAARTIDRTHAYLIAGMAVSWVAFAAACVLLHRLVLDRFGRRAAHLTVLLLAAFPFSFYYGAAYTESLYLLLAVAAFLAMDRRRWWIAGACALLASAERPPGMVIGLCVAVAYLMDWRATRHPPRQDVLALGLAPLGLLAYMAYCWQRFGNPLAYAVASRAGWHGAHLQIGGIEMLVYHLARPDRWLLQGDSTDMFRGIYAVLIVVFCLLVRPIWRTLGPHYGIYALASVILPLLTYPTLNSSGRYASVVFPAFIVLALALRRPALRNFALLTSAALLAISAVLFTFDFGLS